VVWGYPLHHAPLNGVAVSYRLDGLADVLAFVKPPVWVPVGAPPVAGVAAPSARGAPLLLPPGTTPNPRAAGAQRRTAGRVPDAVMRWAPLVAAASAAEGEDADLMLALLWYESAGDPTAASGTGPMGLMQLGIRAAIDMGIRPEQRADPTITVPAAIRYFHTRCRPRARAFANADPSQSEDYWSIALYHDGPYARTLSADATREAAAVLRMRQTVRNTQQ
jgi:soluble lytic murein transglycosylase-like protein